MIRLRKLVVMLLLPLLVLCFLSVTVYGQLADTSLIKMQGDDWSLKVDSVLASSLDSRNSPYMTSKSVTEKELFLQLNTLEDCKSGVVQFKIDMQGLTAYKQLPLTEQEIAEGSFRPKNVENSFACFDNNGKKVLHIYASKIIDAKGVDVWLDQDLKDGLLTVYLPDSKVLEGLSFPLLLDPTFGYTTVGGTNHGLSGHTVSQLVNITEDSEIQNITVYWVGWSVQKTIGALYYLNGTKIAESSFQEGPGGDGSWLDYVFYPSVILENGEYFISSSTNTTDWVTMKYDTAAGTVWLDVAELPSVIDHDGSQWSDRRYSMYISTDTYVAPTPSPSPSATPVVNGDLTDTEWFISALLLILVIINIVLLAFPFALVRFVFGALSFSLCAIAFVFDQIPLAPYLQIMGLVVSVLCMFLATRARE